MSFLVKLLRALDYVLGPRGWRDLTALFRHRAQPMPDILFVAGSQVDVQWAVPAYEAAVARGLRCAFAGPRLSLPEGVPYVDITIHLLRWTRARIMVTATTGLTPSRMPRRCGRRVSIPHSLVSFHMAYPPGTFDGYSDVFCCGKHHLAEIEAMNRRDGITGRRAILVGYGKFESLARTRPEVPPAVGPTRHVLIGPSWGPGNILETMGDGLIRRLLADRWRVTLRPHPSFFTFGDQGFGAQLQAWLELPGFELENSIQESRALWTADVMISDYSGFAMEFAFLRERPVLYVDVPAKVLDPRWRELGPVPLEMSVRDRIGVIVPPQVDEVIGGLQHLLQDSADQAERVRAVREQVWVNFGRFGEVCASELERMLPVQDQ